MDQGGAIVDLRPYAAKLEWPVGIGTKHVQDASYPFLIQEKYRAGYFTHYAGEGTVRSAKICYEGEEVDLCLCRTKAHFSERTSGNTTERILTLDPVEILFHDLKVTLETQISFKEGSSSIQIKRRILSMSKEDAKVTINEYMVGCYGTTEYPEDMTGITLSLEDEAGSVLESLDYAYQCREANHAGAHRASVTIPAIDTRVSMQAQASSGKTCGYVKEGYAFSPMYTLGYTAELAAKEEMVTWLNLEKAH